MRIAALALLLACGGRIQSLGTYGGGFSESDGGAARCENGAPATGRWHLAEQDNALTGDFSICAEAARGPVTGTDDGEHVHLDVGQLAIVGRGSAGLAVIEGEVAHPPLMFRISRLSGGGSAAPVPE